jgi:anti-anti-sigma factor
LVNRGAKYCLSTDSVVARKEKEEIMALDVTLEVEKDTAKITLVGELDGSTVQLFKEKIEEAAKHEVKKLVLLMQDLEFMASAGLRMLIFSKQKMGSDVEIYVVGAQEMVMETIEKTGFHHSVIVVDEYNG